MKKQLTPREAAQVLGQRLDSIYALIWVGRLPAAKIDGKWRIPTAAVETRLKAKKVCNGTPRR